MDVREADGMVVERGDEVRGEATEEVTGFAGIIGRHPRMQAIFEVIRRVAPTGVTVLITGESGTGKELVAQAIHSQSRRHSQRLVPVHCGAIPEELLESEMFGHERGAFTGAVSSRVGRFKLADGGTIFLDEVGDMSTKLQVKLLRVLENGMFEPVGGVSTQQVDVRIVAATNRNLEEAVADKQFREDLYYRLRVVPIEVPPLRARREDIPLLIEWFLNMLHTTKGLPRFEVTPEAMAVLTALSMAGQRARAQESARADGRAGPGRLPDSSREPAAEGTRTDRWRRRERLDAAALGFRRTRHRLLPRDGIDRGSHHRARPRHQPRQQEGSGPAPATEPDDVAREAQAQA